MPQLQNLVLKDDAAADHTFAPLDIKSGLATVVETTGVPLEDKRVQVALNKTASGRYKAIVKMAIPVVQTQTINGVSTPVVVRTAYADISLTFDGSSTLAERKDMAAFVSTAFKSTAVLVYDTVTKVQGVY